MSASSGNFLETPYGNQTTVASGLWEAALLTLRWGRLGAAGVLGPPPRWGGPWGTAGHPHGLSCPLGGSLWDVRGPTERAQGSSHGMPVTAFFGTERHKSKCTGGAGQRPCLLMGGGRKPHSDCLPAQLAAVTK